MGSAERPREYFNDRDQEVTDNIPYAAIVKAVVEIVQRGNFLGPVESNNGFTVLGEPLTGGGGSAHTIQDEGTSLTQRSTMNFVGAGVTATDAGGKTVVTIPGPTYPVSSVNTETGDVVLTSDDIDDTGQTHQFATAAQLAKVDHLSVTQAVDLDTIESDTTVNNAKVTNATHTGEVTGATALTITNGAVVTAKILDANVTNAKLANMANKTLKARNTSGSGVPEDVTVLQVQQWRQTSEPSNATPSINSDNVGRHSITALAAAITSLTVSGTPYDGQLLWISLLDNGTARAIAFGATVEDSTVTMPTTTVISTPLDMLFRWNSVTSKWRLISKA